eukprot:TRINITY_DN23220_c0_g1_i1.p1 TRINITY_DN23220_c0_g1~~TRINITY_DN23220_c0_g1_i1.p1  ORF type:complete len:440 (+),score=24.90 TRINITY_DN23220_c0_g1_i1:67-1386(+)
MKQTLAIGVMCWLAGYCWRDASILFKGTNDGEGPDDSTEPNNSPAAKSLPVENSTKKKLLFSVHPLQRELESPIRLASNYSCMIFVADSMAWSKMRKGIYGYPQFATSIIGQGGYNGDAAVISSPGMGLLDLLNDPSTDYVEKVLNTTLEKGCKGITVQLGINDAFKHLASAAFLSIYRSFVSSIRLRLPDVAFILTSITPCTSYPGGTSRWHHEVNLGISEIAVSVRGIYSDTHWGLLREKQNSKKKSWSGILDDHVHPTNHARYLMGRSIAASVLSKASHYLTSFTCGAEVSWLGYIFKPSWGEGKEWDCSSNPRIVVILTNKTVAFGDLPLPIAVTPPWGSPYGRMPVFGKYTWTATSTDNSTYGASFEYTLGGPAIWFNLVRHTRSLVIQLKREFVGWKPPRSTAKPPPPPPLRPSRPPSDYRDTLAFLHSALEL